MEHIAQRCRTNYLIGSLPDALKGHHNIYGPVIEVPCNVNSYILPSHNNPPPLLNLNTLLHTPLLLTLHLPQLLTEEQSKLKLLNLSPFLPSLFKQSKFESTQRSTKAPAYSETGPSKAVLPFSDDQAHSNVPKPHLSKPLKHGLEKETSRYTIIPV
jgi:hypothetical protein